MERLLKSRDARVQMAVRLAEALCEKIKKEGRVIDIAKAEVGVCKLTNKKVPLFNPERCEHFDLHDAIPGTVSLVIATLTHFGTPCVACKYFEPTDEAFKLFKEAKEELRKRGEAV